MNHLTNDVKQVLITQRELADRAAAMGKEITNDYAGRDLILVGILKGAMPFLTDLMRQIDLPLAIDTMSVSSYGAGTKTTGEVRIKKDLDIDIKGKHVLMVEDIIDTGITLSKLVPLLRERGAASVELAVCLDKEERRQVAVPVKYIGFKIPDEFIVGYGCDYAERYRNLPDVCTLKPKIYQK